MIRFQGGPASMVVPPLELNLSRAPVMLRVVRNRDGKWDALDQTTDEARPDERIFVYRLVGEAASGHMCCSPRSKGGPFIIATYRFLPNQPSDEHLRTTAAWSAWCEANKDRLLAEKRAIDSIYREEVAP